MEMQGRKGPISYLRLITEGRTEETLNKINPIVGLVKASVKKYQETLIKVGNQEKKLLLETVGLFF